MTDLEKFAEQLRYAAFPGSRPWEFPFADVKQRWEKVARIAQFRIDREVDKALRDAVAKAHELGQHESAKAIREMRSARERKALR